MIEKEESPVVHKATCDVLLYRIISAKNQYKDSYIREPNIKIKEKGARIYLDILKNSKDVLSDRDIYLFLIDTEQWSFEEQRKLDSLPKEIENLKVEYFNNYITSSARQKNKALINHKKESFMNLSLKRNKYKNLTSEGIASGAMWFEMINYMYKGTDKLAAINYYHSEMIPESYIRDIVLSNDWSTFTAAGRNIFGRSVVNMTDDQRRLMSWSTVYKNVRSHPDAPNDNIYEDHDAFDGWLILQRRKDKGNKKVQGIKGLDANVANVYVPCKTEEDFNEIMSLNSPEALGKMKREFNAK